MIGAVLVTINPAYRTHELQYVLGQSGVRVLLSAPAFKTSDYRAMVAEVRGNCPGVERVVNRLSIGKQADAPAAAACSAFAAGVGSPTTPQTDCGRPRPFAADPVSPCEPIESRFTTRSTPGVFSATLTAASSCF